MSSGRVGLKRYIIPITFDIFKPMWSMCLLHLTPERPGIEILIKKKK